MTCSDPGCGKNWAGTNSRPPVAWIARALKGRQHPACAAAAGKQRWVVERTFAWLNQSRRLSKAYERLTRIDETWIYMAMTRIMLNRWA